MLELRSVSDLLKIILRQSMPNTITGGDDDDDDEKKIENALFLFYRCSLVYYALRDVARV